MRRQELSTADLDLRNAELQKKKELIELVFLKAREELKKADLSKRRAFLTTLLDRAKKEMTIATIYCTEKDKPIVAKLAKARVVTQAMLGGMILEDKSGSVRIDYSFEMILQSIQERSLGEIGSILFR